jgi:hypothetical protein
MDVVSLFCKQPQPILDPSPAVVYRLIDTKKPTLIVDEIDHIFGPRAQYPQLQSIFNGGFETGTEVPRMGGPRMTELEFFSPYCPKMFAGLIELPSTFASRCLQIEMRPRTNAEPGGEDFIKEDEREQTADLRDLLAELLRLARESGTLPRKPPRIDNPALRDRQQAALRPLHAIAIAACDQWSTWLRKAVDEHLADGVSTRSEQSLGVKLLADVNRVFADRGDPTAIFTTDIIDALVALENSPWGEYELLTPKRLATMLRPYIRPCRARNLRIGDSQRKGYERADFTDAWQRYKIIPTPAPENGETRPTRPRAIFKPFQQDTAPRLAPSHPSHADPPAKVGHLGRSPHPAATDRNPHDHADGTDGTDQIRPETAGREQLTPTTEPLPHETHTTRSSHGHHATAKPMRHCATCQKEKPVKKRASGLEYLSCGHHVAEDAA